jgi:hypothetical protein
MTPATCATPLCTIPLCPERCCGGRTTRVDSPPDGQPVFGVRITEGADVLDQRVILAGFDSAGVPMNLVVFETPPNEFGKRRIAALAVRFGDEAGPQGYRAPESGAPQDEVPQLGQPIWPPAGWERLSEVEVSRARRLVEWVWEHRCEEGGPARGGDRLRPEGDGSA